MSLTQVVHRKGHISHVKAGTKKNRIKAHICHLGKEDGHRTKSLKQAADKSVGANNHLWNRETIFLFAAYGSSGPQRQCNRACYPKADFFFCLRWHRLHKAGTYTTANKFLAAKTIDHLKSFIKWGPTPLLAASTAINQLPMTNLKFKPTDRCKKFNGSATAALRS